MQFGPAVTEYILPGLPVTAALAYALYRLHPASAGDPALPELHSGVFAAAGLVFLSVAYMLGVAVHRVGRYVLRGAVAAEEKRAWDSFGRYCTRVALARLGDGVDDELPPKPTAKTDGGAISPGKPDPGWVLWRMRLHLCHFSPACADEILKLQAISRAARGALAVPISLGIWLIADLVQCVVDPTAGRAALLAALLTSAIVLWFGVKWTHSYRWGVVSRGTIAAFLSSGPYYPQAPTGVRQETNDARGKERAQEGHISQIASEQAASGASRSQLGSGKDGRVTTVQGRSTIETVLNSAVEQVKKMSEVSEQRGTIPLSVGTAATILTLAVARLFYSGGAGPTPQGLTAAIIVAGLIMVVGMVLRSLEHKWYLAAQIEDRRLLSDRLRIGFDYGKTVMKEAAGEDKEGELQSRSR